MKKITFLTVALFTILISQSVSARPVPYSFKSSAEIQTFFNVSSGTQVEKLKYSLDALNAHTLKIQKEISDASTVSDLPKVTVVATPTLSLQTNNGVTQNILGQFKLQLTGGRGDTYAYSANIVLKNVQTGAEVYATNTQMIPTESGTNIPLNHKTYGNILVTRVPEGAVKTFSVVSVSVPQSTQTAMYVMEIRSVQYFSNATSTAPAKSISLSGMLNTKTNMATVDGVASTGGPIITNVKAYASTTSAVFVWTTDRLSDSKVLYGTSSKNYIGSAVVSTMVTNHSVYQLFPYATTYYFVVESKDASGKVTRSPEQTVVILPAKKAGVVGFFQDYFKNVRAQVIYMFGR